jgi:hypothetical protein
MSETYAEGNTAGRIGRSAGRSVILRSIGAVVAGIVAGGRFDPRHRCGAARGGCISALGPACERWAAAPGYRVSDCLWDFRRLYHSAACSVSSDGACDDGGVCRVCRQYCGGDCDVESCGNVWAALVSGCSDFDCSAVWVGWRPVVGSCVASINLRSSGFIFPDSFMDEGSARRRVGRSG